ncbi:hypothetical protein LOTGIDRAFT_161898 [Lottia gigantea]|uniref:Uncharacterized protein n=1 Tax=Lottia gigantea TaxID=225164 RepID=V4A9D1_LOTGI|nr:hypothetical protein LOTGIDRAFT_161898 [Lottia gigantea]ESO93337.1 hypothetical protein LOTGIDRAFT_161898 [Lottia gigantea]
MDKYLIKKDKLLDGSDTTTTDTGIKTTAGNTTDAVPRCSEKTGVPVGFDVEVNDDVRTTSNAGHLFSYRTLQSLIFYVYVKNVEYVRFTYVLSSGFEQHSVWNKGIDSNTISIGNTGMPAIGFYLLEINFSSVLRGFQQMFILS